MVTLGQTESEIKIGKYLANPMLVYLIYPRSIFMQKKDYNRAMINMVKHFDHLLTFHEFFSKNSFCIMPIFFQIWRILSSFKGIAQE